MVELHPTRSRLIGLLRRRRGATLSDLQRFTGLSRSTLRQHLTILERDGLIRERLARPTTGRPPIFYEPTDVLSPRPLPPQASTDVSEAETRIRAALATLLAGAEVTAARRSPTEYEVIINGCPLTPLSPESEAVCGITARLLSALVAGEVEQREWIVRGDQRCVFVLRWPVAENTLASAGDERAYREDEDG